MDRNSGLRDVCMFHHTCENLVVASRTGDSCPAYSNPVCASTMVRASAVSGDATNCHKRAEGYLLQVYSSAISKHGT